MAAAGHYIVAVADGTLHIYVETRIPGALVARLVPVQSITDTVADVIATDGGRSRHPPRRLPSLQIQRRTVFGAGRFMAGRSGQRRDIGRLAAALDAYLRRRPDASWDFVGSTAFYAMLVDVLSPPTLRRLKRVLARLPVDEYAQDTPPELTRTR